MFAPWLFVTRNTLGLKTAPYITNLALQSPPATGLWAKIPSLPSSSTVTQALPCGQVSSSPRKPCGSEAAGVEGASILAEADFVAKVFRLFFRGQGNLLSPSALSKWFSSQPHLLLQTTLGPSQGAVRLCQLESLVAK